MSKRLTFGAMIVIALVLVGTVGGWNLLRESSAATIRWQAPNDAAEVQNPIPHNDATVTAGKKIYQKNCVACHGDRGRGRGPAAIALDPRPPSFRNSYVAAQPDGALFWKITQGRAPMPSWQRSLNEDERWQVIHYLHTLSGKVPVADK